MTLTRQIFFRFYLVIIGSVVIVGLSIDYLWQSVDQNSQSFEYEKILKFAGRLIIASEQPPELFIEQINGQKENKINLVPLDQISGDSIYEKLNQGEVVVLDSARGHLDAYYKIPDSNYLISMTMDKPEQFELNQYLMLILFYSLIALFVYLMTKPLVRDLNNLENAVSQFADSAWDTKVKVSANSPVSHLASAYNSLVVRIKQLLNDQQEMSHAISHELRTPLARIKFSLEIALQAKDKSNLAEQLESINDDVVEIQNLVDELLNFSSLEKSSITVNIEKGDLQSLIEHLTTKLKKNHPEKTIIENFRCNAKDVYCDSYLLERALQNLIINGLKFSEQQVIVEFNRDKDWYQIIVKDDGPGIAEKDQKRVFDSFVRLEEKQTTKGFGLGLAIVNRIAKLHSGKVSVTNSESGGAKFIFTWPKPKF